jgi:hypothetical protein
MPLIGKFYIAATAIAGLLAGAKALLDTSGTAPAGVMYYILLSMLFGSWKVRLPGLGSTISPHFLVIFIGIVQMPLPVTLAGLFAGLTMQLYLRAGKKPNAMQAIFNYSSLCLTTVASYGVFHAGSAMMDPSSALAVLMVLMASSY